MSSKGSALLRACLFASVPIVTFAQSPVIVEAESQPETRGANLTTATDATGVSYITTTENSAINPTPARTATWRVDFPAAGNYALYVRIYVGPIGGADDSFYIPSGFNNSTNWTGLYNTSTGGATAPNQGVPTGGTAGQNVWKWVRMTALPGAGGGTGPANWVVPDGALSQNFSWGSREDGLLFDKFAFGPVNACYTVADLDAGRAPSITCPPPPPADPPAYTRTGQPLATGQAKFLGSAWSPNNASLNFGAYWNQVTPENAGKWGSAQPTSPFGPAPDYVTNPTPPFNFAQAHAAEAQAVNNGQLFKWHTLFWGNQQPAWIESLPVEKQQEAIRIWLQGIKNEFPNLQMIEVVNEPLHDPPRGATNGNYIEALGGDNGLYGTGWDWIIRSFELAREYFPNAKLVLNDYSITNDGNATTRYLEIIELLKARHLIDVVGIQAHAFEFNYNNLAGSAATHTANLARLKAAGLPVIVTEFDIDGIDPVWGLPDDNVQLERFRTLFPVFWENDAVTGVTLWGYVRGAHWRTNQGAWLMYPNGAERPALQWLVSYIPDVPPAVTPGQTFSIAENTVPSDPDYQTARQFLEQQGYIVNSDSLATAMLMLKHPGTFTDEFGTWTGGLANYNGTNVQFIAFTQKYGEFSVGIPLGTLTATDVDSGQTLSGWRIETNTPGANDGSIFAIDPVTGLLAQKVSPSLDFEFQASFTFQVTVSDGFKRSAPQDVTVRLTNLNDNPPAIPAGQSYRIDGGSNNSVARVIAIDADNTNQPGFTSFSAWTITAGNPNNVFRYNGTGTLQVGRPLLIDWRRTSYSLATTVSDGTSVSAVEPVIVTIPNRVNLCLANVIKLEAPKATAPLLILLGSTLGTCNRPL